MLFFSFTLGLQSIVSKDFRLSLTIGLSVLFLSSMYCIAMTNTRTVYLGFFIFWPLFLWSWKKKYFIVFFILFLIISSLFWGHMQKFLTRAERGVAETQTINYASSGRFSLWGHNIQVFESLPIWQKLMGVGFGNEQKPVVNAGTRQNVVSSHNDYLSLLMVSGIIGLLLYGLIQMAFLINILKSGIRRRLKLFFIALLLTVFAMNLVSNSYINRFPLAQLFWFYVGLFYSLSNMDRMRSRSAGI